MMEKDALDDDTLALKTRAGDPRALAILYRRHAPTLARWLERRLGNRADAEDVLHDAFLRLIEARGGYEGRGRFRSWLFQVAAHRASDLQRRSRRRREILETAGKGAAGADWQPPAELDPVVRRIESTLADLPPSYAAAFHLRVREGFAYRDMAAISGEPEGTLRSRVYHAIRRIRQALEGNSVGRRNP